MLIFFIKIFIKSSKISYYNIILGGLFGIFRSGILILLFFFCFSFLNKSNYDLYISNSILISIYFEIMKYVLFFFHSL
ncbi:hypothetical protein D9V59_00830 [Buchnera aphidicola (Artemisaphis artemisicola)]|uniref:Uncharacterized protein n=1 Tax=Buchnera aphidicola (Artemisaphis artemisicola) TaxID=1241836 RepID=A0A4D6XMC2_9GAMM|nr:hypothetical protein D9V59_00830 [Buchnera aphidicola (Artemisaphis artemisicola)]